jgi:hypothetical protein
VVNLAWPQQLTHIPLVRKMPIELGQPDIDGIHGAKMRLVHA